MKNADDRVYPFIILIAAFAVIDALERLQLLMISELVMTPSQELIWVYVLWQGRAKGEEV